MLILTILKSTLLNFICEYMAYFVYTADLNTSSNCTMKVECWNATIWRWPNAVVNCNRFNSFWQLYRNRIGSLQWTHLHEVHAIKEIASDDLNKTKFYVSKKTLSLNRVNGDCHAAAKTNMATLVLFLCTSGLTIDFNIKRNYWNGNHVLVTTHEYYALSIR